MRLKKYILGKFREFTFKVFQGLTFRENTKFKVFIGNEWVLFRVRKKDININLADFLALFDTLDYSKSINLSDLAGLYDTLTTNKHLVRNLIDNAGVYDLLSSTVDATQHFVVNLQDLVSAYENFNSEVFRGYIENIVDYAGVYDTLVSSVDRAAHITNNLSDYASTYDTVSIEVIRNIKKNLQDLASTYESMTSSVNRAQNIVTNLQDLISAFDTLERIINISRSAGPDLSSTYDQVSSSVQRYLNVTNPEPGDVYAESADILTVEWSKSSYITHVQIDISTDGGSTWQLLDSSNNGTSTNYILSDLQLDGLPSSNCKVRVKNVTSGGNNEVAYSGTFTINLIP